MSIPPPVVELSNVPANRSETASPASPQAPDASAQPRLAARGAELPGVGVGFLADEPATRERRGRTEPPTASRTITGDQRVTGAGGRRAADRAASAGALAENPDEGAADADGVERRSGLDRRRGPGRRRTDYRRAAEEGEMTEEQLTFLMAVDEYKRSNDRRHPTLTEILDVLLYLGYRKVAEPGEFKLTKPRQTPERRKPAAPQN